MRSSGSNDIELAPQKTGMRVGIYSRTTARNDASPGRGQWNLDNAYRYVSEAYGGYPLESQGKSVRSPLRIIYKSLTPSL
jgi:hypothetical protein